MEISIREMLMCWFGFSLALTGVHSYKAFEGTGTGWWAAIFAMLTLNCFMWWLVARKRGWN